MLNTLSAESPSSTTKRVCSPRTTMPRLSGPCRQLAILRRPLLRLRIRRYEQHADPARRRNGKLLRFETLAANYGDGLHARSGRQAGELGAARLPCRFPPRLPVDEQFDRLAGKVVGERASDDANGHGAGGNVADRQRHAGNLLRIRHHLRLTAAAADRSDTKTIAERIVRRGVMTCPRVRLSSGCRSACRTLRPDRWLFRSCTAAPAEHPVRGGRQAHVR